MAAEPTQLPETRSQAFQIDATYEFSAPRFFDFIDGETHDEIRAAEMWFERDHRYAPSPLIPRTKEERPILLKSLCSFKYTEENEREMGPESNNRRTLAEDIGPDENLCNSANSDIMDTSQQEESCAQGLVEQISGSKLCEDRTINHNVDSYPLESSSITQASKAIHRPVYSSEKSVQGPNSWLPEACTPDGQIVPADKPPVSGTSVNDTAKRISRLVDKYCPKSQVRVPGHRSVKPFSTKNPSLPSADKKSTAAGARSVPTKSAFISIAQENQAIKRQKLEEGKSRQILNIRNMVLPHKTKPGTSGGDDVVPWATRSGMEERKERSQRKVYAREQPNPFVSAAELVHKFHSNTRNIDVSVSNRSLSQDDADSVMQRRPALKLTQPREPDLQTAHRIRPVKVKSTAELEEEMLANMPTFKARPLNRKILEGPTFPAPSRTAPHPPEFEEFHMKATERAGHHVGVLPSSTSSVESLSKPLKLTEPRTPRLETSLRARPIKVKSAQELEEEELEKMPKFKARPLNRKILESKGEFGIFCSTKQQITIPKEFHFATDQRIPSTKTVVDLFDTLSLNSDPHSEHQLPRITTPDPFYLQTEERGMEKERRFIEDLTQKQLEEERARIPKANPYPYTTDIPVIPPKPEPKPCTKPEAFQLESLIRHEEEMQRQMEEKQKKEREEALMRTFRARPIMKEVPVALPEKIRKPLTQVQEFVLRVDDRAINRAEFDKKVIEKEMMYKRYREENEMNQKIEEEKELKQMRRMMVPHARPVPNFANPFLPQRSSQETTKPKSPKFHIAERVRRTVCSTAVADMR